MKSLKDSRALEILQRAQQQDQPLRLALLDVDSTWSGTPADQLRLRQLLEAAGYVIGIASSRTSEMFISWSERDRSSKTVQKRSPAKFSLTSADPEQVRDPATVPGLQGLLDPDIVIGSSGTELLWRGAEGGYDIDDSYQHHFPASSQQWQAGVKQLLATCGQQGISFTIHQPTTIAPIDWRIEVWPTTSTDFTALLNALKNSHCHITHDNTHIFITPTGTSKEAAADHAITRLLQQLAIDPAQLHVFFAGDSAADAPMGFTSGPKTTAAFVIPGQASLYRELTNGRLTSLYQQMTKRNKKGTLPKGVYWFPPQARLIVIGDEAFPGTAGPQTLIGWLRTQQ